MLKLNESRGVRKVVALLLRWQRKEVAGDLAGARRAAAGALPSKASERVQAVVDRDFLAGTDALPCEDFDARAHRVRFAGVIQVAAWRQQNCAPRVVELTEMSSF